MTSPVVPSHSRNTPLVLFGPPGTGKTKRLQRSANAWLDAGVHPSSLAYATFTRAARLEFTARLQAERGISESSLPWVRTIHSMCYRLLGLDREQVLTERAWCRFAALYGYDLSSPDSAKDENELDLAVGEFPRQTADDRLRSAYYWGRNRRMTPERTLARSPTAVPSSAFTLFVARLQEFKTELGLLDFADMLERALQSDERPPVDVALVDEAQDLSPLQIALVEKWFGPCRELVIAGDDDQTIFGFQAADPSWLLRRARDYRTEVLGRSYRLPRSVHSLAMRIIGRNRNRVAKEYHPRDAEGRVLTCDDDEALGMLDDATDSLVLARNRCFLGRAARILLDRGIPFEVEGAGGQSPLSHKFACDAVRTALRLRDGEVVAVDELADLLRMVPRSDVDLVPASFREGAAGLRGPLDRGRLIAAGGHSIVAAIDRLGPAEILRKLPSAWRRYFNELVARYGSLPAPRVKLTSVHGAKGREASTVVLLPDMTRATHAEFGDGLRGGYEAENRVAYVGVTRAKETLVLVRPRTRRFYDFPIAAEEDAAHRRAVADESRHRNEEEMGR